jgi:hypothetical protein
MRDVFMPLSRHLASPFRENPSKFANFNPRHPASGNRGRTPQT